MKRLPLAAGLLLLAACAGPSAEAVRAAVAAAPDAGRILPVPFFPQEEYQCGPAAVASIPAYWGGPAAPRASAQAASPCRWRASGRWAPAGEPPPGGVPGAPPPA